MPKFYRINNAQQETMRVLFALFIWLGIPVILTAALDLQGAIWKILLFGVFGIVAMYYYALSSKRA